ncbi:MAG TPA: hypothetical protein GXX63_07105 [Tissierellia bacterium]|nr:hypothetical protein [Tissierellia bacterium]
MKDKKILDQELTEADRTELLEAEVNMYEKDCGQAQLHCITDCFPFGTAFINPNR